ncbi:hypothetical protein [Saccharopolyspora griseoalba]|uniref:Uncharacterized protein n=1 Tax=Saccharopolyspora griseoalba TaxID=1431848 RepID=A0ABW2LTB0_9PSEU
MEDDELVLMNTRVPRAWREAWGRLLKQQGTDRSTRIRELMRADLQTCDNADARAALQEGEEVLAHLAARKRLGRPPEPSSTAAAAVDEVQDAAMRYAREHFPRASNHHRAAFANAMCAALTGCAGGYGGPSVREHAAARVIAGRRLSWEAALEVLADPDGVIFGPITDLHRYCWETEHHFDDDPEDRKLIEGQ